jgi:hypothetical protein
MLEDHRRRNGFRNGTQIDSNTQTQSGTNQGQKEPITGDSPRSTHPLNLARSLPLISIMAATTTRRVESPSVNNLALFKYLLASLVRTVDCGFRYEYVLGFDKGDPFYDSKEVNLEASNISSYASVSFSYLPMSLSISLSLTLLSALSSSVVSFSACHSSSSSTYRTQTTHLLAHTTHTYHSHSTRTNPTQHTHTHTGYGVCAGLVQSRGPGSDDEQRHHYQPSNSRG